MTPVFICFCCLFVKNFLGVSVLARCSNFFFRHDWLLIVVTAHDSSGRCRLVTKQKYFACVVTQYSAYRSTFSNYQTYLEGLFFTYLILYLSTSGEQRCMGVSFPFIAMHLCSPDRDSWLGFCNWFFTGTNGSYLPNLFSQLSMLTRTVSCDVIAPFSRFCCASSLSNAHPFYTFQQQHVSW